MQKSVKDWERFTKISHSLNVLKAVPDGFSSAVLVNLSGTSIFSTQDLSMIALSSF